MKFAVFLYIFCWQAVVSFSYVTSNFLVNSSASKITNEEPILSELKASVDRKLSPLSRRSRLNYQDDLYRAPQRQHRLEDFLWAGSGEGPISSDTDGMAWEDGIAQSSGTAAIKVTKTMVLYRTVLSTIYPVAMTPIVVTSTIQFTPILTSPMPVTLLPSPSQQLVDSSQFLMTPSFTSIVIQPTVSISRPTEKPNENNESSEGLHDRLSASSTDLRYWVQTTIKTKKDHIDHSSDIEFQESMQNKLARIYARAFKRQLLNSLGVMNHSERHGNRTEMLSGNNSRQRRSSHSAYFDVEAIDVQQHLYNTDPTRMAKTAMNVTVAIMNISCSEPIHQVFIKYVVFAEGAPVPGFVAVKELKVVSKEEMEKHLGYEVITKAEALVQPMESYEVGASATPWLVAIIALVSLMILILAITMFMVWKWKHNRLRDMNRATSSRNEGGVVHPVFPSAGAQGVSGGGYAQQRPSSRERRPSVTSHTSGGFRSPREGEEAAGSLKDGSRGVSSSDQQFPTSDEKSSSSRLIGPSPYQSPRRFKSKPVGLAKKVSKRRRRRRKSHVMSLENRGFEETPEKLQNKEIAEHQRQTNGRQNEDFSFTTEICRNMDKISYGNLDICPESLARTPSAQAKKLIESRPSSHEYKQSVRKTHTDEIKDEKEHTLGEIDNQLHDLEGIGDSFHEQDRELSERSFEIADSTSADAASTKDAEVQTPTRLIRRSPRIRTTSRSKGHGKTSKMSLVSAESEDAVEFQHLPTSSDELNPLGKMRKRFHQFLDDAFNVMASGKKQGSERAPHPRSAKVTLSHHIKTKTTGRPWTSHVIREESVRKIRPKSSVALGPPKSAWTVASQRRCHSAKSKVSIFEEEEEGVETENVVEACDINDERQEGNLLSSRSTSTTHTDGQPSQPDSSKSLMFPKYPTYPEIELCLENDPNRTAIPGTSQTQTRSRLHPLDPAVPLIEAIKDEMKRFERVKVSSDSSKT